MTGWVEVRPPAYSKQAILRIALPGGIVSNLAALPANDWIGPLVEAVAHGAGDRFGELVRDLRASNQDTLAVFTVLAEATGTVDIQSTRRVGPDFWRIM
jgi:hypothetical protein